MYYRDHVQKIMIKLEDELASKLLQIRIQQTLTCQFA